jgi:uncharacterized protein (DUF2147 family)
MSIHRLAVLSIFGGVVAGSMAIAPAASAQSVIEGIWLTPQQSEMTISACVEGFCGFISKIVITEETRAKYGDALESVESYTDYNNKDPNLRHRPIEGLQILTLRQGADPWHYEGEIYNPEDGNVYAGYLEVRGPDSMMLKGCALMVLCLEQEWPRVGAE